METIQKEGDQFKESKKQDLEALVQKIINERYKDATL
jgi:hypothetical protein